MVGFLKRIWSVGFARISNKSQADGFAKFYGCIMCILCFVVVIDFILDSKGLPTMDSLLVVVLVAAIYSFIGFDIYRNKSRGMAIFCFIMLIPATIQWGYKLLHGDIKALAGLIVLVVALYIHFRLIYATFMFHRFNKLQPKIE